jgi:hypothetical protein
MAQFKKVPKGCGKCNNKILELNNLVARCLTCGWSSNLASINDFIERMKRRRDNK